MAIAVLALAAVVLGIVAICVPATNPHIRLFLGIGLACAGAGLALTVVPD